MLVADSLANRSDGGNNLYMLSNYRCSDSHTFGNRCCLQQDA